MTEQDHSSGNIKPFSSARAANDVLAPFPSPLPVQAHVGEILTSVEPVTWPNGQAVSPCSVQFSACFTTGSNLALKSHLNNLYDSASLKLNMSLNYLSLNISVNEKGNKDSPDSKTIMETRRHWSRKYEGDRVSKIWSPNFTSNIVIWYKLINYCTSFRKVSQSRTLSQKHRVLNYTKGTISTWNNKIQKAIDSVYQLCMLNYTVHFFSKSST